MSDWDAIMPDMPPNLLIEAFDRSLDHAEEMIDALRRRRPQSP